MANVCNHKLFQQVIINFLIVQVRVPNLQICMCATSKMAQQRPQLEVTAFIVKHMVMAVLTRNSQRICTCLEKLLAFKLANICLAYSTLHALTMCAVSILQIHD